MPDAQPPRPVGSILFRCDGPAVPLGVVLTPDRPAGPWRGRTVLFRHRPDGLVEAASGGRKAIGRDEDEALRRLGEHPAAGDTRPHLDLGPAGDTDTHTPLPPG